MNFCRPTILVKQNIFERNLKKIRSPNIYASYGTFWVQIVNLFAPLSVYEDL